MIGTLAAIVAQLSLTVSAPDSVGIRETALVKLEVRSPSLLPPEITPPAFGVLVLARTAMQSRTTMNNGERRTTFTYQYYLNAPAPGRYTLAPFEARSNGQTARSPRISFVVRTQPAPVVPAIVARARIDSARPVTVATLGTPDTVYVGEQATYQVAVFVDENTTRQRSARNPSFTPPDLRGTLSYELPPTQAVVPTRTAGGRSYRPYIYQRAIFPLVPGSHVVPAATLDYTLPVSAGYSNRLETHTLRADSVLIVALPLPEAGRPEDFDGAVGSLRIQQIVATRPTRVGDPFTVTARVSGTGNIKLLPRPQLRLDWADVLPAGERVETEIRDGRVGGSKEFDWVVTPRSAGTHLLPGLRYPVFDPSARRYAMATSAGDSLEVLAGAIVMAAEIPPEPERVAPIRSRLGTQRPPPLHRSRIFLAAFVLAPLPTLLVLLARSRRSGAPRSRSPAATLSHLSAASGGDAAEIRRAFLAMIERRLALAPGVSAASDRFTRALLRAGVSREVASRADSLLRRMDAQVFGKDPGADPIVAEEVLACYMKIDAEAKSGTAAFVPALLPPALMLVTALALQAERDAEGLFGRAAESYRGGRYAEAAELFRDAARLAPRAPNAWANAGTASWQLHDTAGAMLAWQRAVRLDPTSGELRDQISKVAHARLSSAGFIPPLPLDALAALALVSWIIGWIRIYQVVRARQGSWRGAAALLLLSVATIALLIQMIRRVEDRSAAVVASTVTTHSLAALGSEPIARLNAGEVVRRVARNGEWSMIEFNGRPAGWVHSTQLLPISID